MVTMQLSPAAPLSGYDMDVIELDGSVSLTLSVADATSNTGRHADVGRGDPTVA